MAQGSRRSRGGRCREPEVRPRRRWRAPGAWRDSYKTPITPQLKALVNPQGGETNCRACAVSVDRLLAEEAPSSAPGRLKGGPTAPIEALYGGRQFKSSTLSGIVYEIRNAGDGARDIVMGQKGRRAHVFNVVNVKGDGDVVFLDGQSGHADLSPWRNFSLLRTDWCWTSKRRPDWPRGSWMRK
ncbi:toxin glutamine deamidase domain-containing protein [Streptomyces sp. D2-8]|uniref:toxin glutamine deamidase domain-containing protein n=1 Tax=Streptomyces sp. D2-8 TaxID=2707767 RepID=UPI0020BEADDB|nr:toxin glutamine deamidase domain-containing protein [Streptomyces sp. D2-8]